MVDAEFVEIKVEEPNAQGPTIIREYRVKGSMKEIFDIVSKMIDNGTVVGAIEYRQAMSLEKFKNMVLTDED